MEAEASPEWIKNDVVMRKSAWPQNGSLTTARRYRSWELESIDSEEIGSRDDFDRHELIL